MVVCDVSKPWGISIKRSNRKLRVSRGNFHYSPLDELILVRVFSNREDDQPLGFQTPFVCQLIKDELLKEQKPIGAIAP
ncbi:hypothetical protein Tco_1107459 [Tanacetum coccineum]